MKKVRQNQAWQVPIQMLNSPWAYIWEGLFILEGYLPLEVGGAYFGEGVIIGILRYFVCSLVLYIHLGPVVQKPVNANLVIKVNQGLCFSS